MEALCPSLSLRQSVCLRMSARQVLQLPSQVCMLQHPVEIPTSHPDPIERNFNLDSPCTS